MTGNNEYDIFADFEKDLTTDVSEWRTGIVQFGKDSLDSAVADFMERHNRFPDFNDEDDSSELHDYIRDCLDREFSLSGNAALHEDDIVSAKGRFSAMVEDEAHLLCPFTPDEQERLCGTVVRMDSLPYLDTKWLDTTNNKLIPTDPRQLNSPFGVHLVLKDAYVSSDVTHEIKLRFDGDVLVAMNYEEMLLRREANVLSDQA